MPEITFVKGYIPGSIGRIAELHGTYYHKHWGFGLYFESKVAVELSAFLNRYDQSRDGLWTVQAGGRIQGAIAIDGFQANNEGAHVRWFIVSEHFQGTGLGNRLLNSALDFCRKNAYTRIYLWTFQGLDRARHLYEKNGFRLVEEHPGAMWGTTVNEQRFLCQLSAQG